ncbi:TMV resistance protein N-like [Eucalyptus grandis]|uniref:TMV resistance protein N-like n=1 Tax=Eucalyptus grandis TaxID=71139 RepID=UPI0008A0EC7A|nr:TMV resistance protein N-like [Eucalyptus grandis]XP_039167020.1 TMV resistance protein N-like [Eucalyptus grandis]
MKVDEIKGLEAKKYKGHGELIKLVVEEVVKKLKKKHRSVPEHLVRIDDRVSAVRDLLDIDFGDVRFIRIHGMGGIGKTTLAKVVFNEISSHFGKCCCFLDDIQEKSSRIDDLVELQKKLLSEIGTHAGTKSIDEIDDGMNRIGEVLCKKKVLIVLDNVDNGKQMEKLIGRGTLCSGSRILITTRNKIDLRTKYQIFNYEMGVMSDDPALELFSWHAFNRDSPSHAYDDLSREIVSATRRLPLALEIIGSFLYGNKSQKLWKETLKKLKKAPDENVFRKLKVSYDALTFEQQQIFLDIACFFVGEDMRSALYVWKDCEFYPHSGVRVLINMSLVKIVKNNKFWMHDQLRDLGREIVHQENRTNHGEQSRIWNCEAILDTIGTEEMKKNAVALDLDVRKSYPEVVVRSEDIGRFKCLKYLKLYGGTFTGDLANSLTNLSWILWNHPHPMSNPTNMHLKNVVVLQFSDNNSIDDSQLQSLITMARKLKVLSLNGCNKITRTPDFSKCLNLESLNVNSCSNLREIDGSIGKLKCLIDIKIVYCPHLKFLPEEIGYLVKLEEFTIQRCDGVKSIPKSIWKLKSLREVHFSAGRGSYSADS